jgi:hypothetical protein
VDKLALLRCNGALHAQESAQLDDAINRVARDIFVELAALHRAPDHEKVRDPRARRLTAVIDRAYRITRAAASLPRAPWPPSVLVSFEQLMRVLLAAYGSLEASDLGIEPRLRQLAARRCLDASALLQTVLSNEVAAREVIR